MIIRNDYIKELEPFFNVKIVKILAGIRRCGKSTIFEMLSDEFVARGTLKSHIILKRYSEEGYDNSFTS